MVFEPSASVYASKAPAHAKQPRHVQPCRSAARSSAADRKARARLPAVSGEWSINPLSDGAAGAIVRTTPAPVHRPRCSAARTRAVVIPPPATFPYGHCFASRDARHITPEGCALLASLRVRLLILVLVAVVPTVAIVVLSAREQRRLLVEQASGGAAALAQLVAERGQRSVDSAHGLLLGMSRMRTIAGLDGPTCSARLAPLLATAPIFVNIAAADSQGKLFCSAAKPQRFIDVSDREFFRGAMRSGGFTVGDYVVSRVRGKGALGFGYPVRNEGGEIVSVAIASLDVAMMQQDLDELEVPPGAEVAVLDRGGVTLSARPNGASWLGRPFDAHLVDSVRSARGSVTLAGTDGVTRLYSLREVTAPDGTVAMHVLAGIPMGAILDPVNRVSSRALLGSLLASALALAAAVLMAEFMLVRRLRRLAATSHRIAAGDLTARTGLPARADELGELVTSFDDMASALEELEREKVRREEQVCQAQKMEAVGQLAGGIAHDFNNLLTVILSAASALRDELPPGHPGLEDAGDVLHAGERAAALTRQLLAFSRRQALAPRVVDLGDT